MPDVYQMYSRCSSARARAQVRANCISYSSCISSCEWRLSFYLLHQMTSTWISPNDFIFNTARVSFVFFGFPRVSISHVTLWTEVMTSCSRSTEWAHVLHIIRNMGSFEAHPVACLHRRHSMLFHKRLLSLLPNCTPLVGGYHAGVLMYDMHS